MTTAKQEDLSAGLAPLLKKFSPITHWLRPPNDHPSHVKRPLSSASVAKHLNGGPYIGAGMIAPGQDTTMVAVLDFDSHKGETPWPEMQAVGLRVAAALQTQGGAPIAFRSSGGAGLHLYCLWDTPQDAYSVRQWLRAGLAAAGLKPGTGGVVKGEVEAFPKQDAVPDGRHGSMVVIPLAGKSVPLDPFDLDDCPKDFIMGEGAWPMSVPVPVLAKPERATGGAAAGDGDLAMLESMLDAIPNDTAPLDYDAWRDVVFAIHHATGGSDVGLELAHTFSARAPKYDPDFLDNRVWPYIDAGHASAITVRTIDFLARKAGWSEPAELIAADFDALPEPVDEKGDKLPPLPNFDRTNKGEILANINNLLLAVRDARCTGVTVRYDDFRAEIMAAPLDDKEGWRPFEDADYTDMQAYMERGGFQKIAKEALRDAVWNVAQKQRFDSAIAWLAALTWDGVPRIGNFLAHYCGTDDTPYTRAVSRYLWSALAGRVMQPGVQADMAPVLVGAQGLRKSSGVAAMVPAREFFTEMDLAVRDAEASRRMRGRLVIELAELKGLHSKDSESIKEFITKRVETWRPLYKEFDTQFPRRHLFLGTTNEPEFLSDDTGERRWLPVEVVRMVDVDAIERDCAQLWVEGRELFLGSGVQWADAERLAKGVHSQHKIYDPWTPVVERWLLSSDFDAMDGSPGPDRRDEVTSHDVLVGALGVEAKHVKRGDEQRVARVLTCLGYRNDRKYVDGRRVRIWVYQHPDPDLV